MANKQIFPACTKHILILYMPLRVETSSSGQYLEQKHSSQWDNVVQRSQSLER